MLGEIIETQKSKYCLNSFARDILNKNYLKSNNKKTGTQILEVGRVCVRERRNRWWGKRSKNDQDPICLCNYLPGSKCHTSLIYASKNIYSRVWSNNSWRVDKKQHSNRIRREGKARVEERKQRKKQERKEERKTKGRKEEKEKYNL